MDWTPILGSLTGGVLGFVGNLATKWVAMKEAKQNHEFRVTELKLTQEIDVQKADLLLRQTTEEKSFDAMKAAIEAQGRLSGSSPMVQDILALFRPGLTTFVLALTAVLFFFVSQDTKDYIILSYISLASVAGGFWFGDRTSAKLLTSKLSKTP